MNAFFTAHYAVAAEAIDLKIDCCDVALVSKIDSEEIVALVSEQCECPEDE